MIGDGKSRSFTVINLRLAEKLQIKPPLIG
jgi:hypothetical protein